MTEQIFTSGPWYPVEYAGYWDLQAINEYSANEGWKTAEGYYKDIPYKQAFQDAWHNWDESSRQCFLDLPNFSPDIFLEITGVDVTKQ